MELIRIFGLTFVYILILIIQIISLIIVTKKNEKDKWKKLFIFEAISLAVALALWGIFWIILSDNNDFWEDIAYHLVNLYGSVGAVVAYGLMLMVSTVVRVIRHAKCE